MAVVYHGTDLLLNREVAVKILRDQYVTDENFLLRFEREGQIAAGMSHPNLVSVYDVGHDHGQHYIVMEYVQGPNLKELIVKKGPFSVDGAVFIIGQVAAALDYAHRRGLVHRDIKPQNILVDRQGNAKVVDFGIAKGIKDPSITEAGTGMGTVHYVSPEQARGEHLGSGSDIYSTGVVLFEMLTCSLPFDADTPVGVAMHHVSSSPPAPSSIVPSIPPQIDAIVLKTMAKRPEDRYPSGAALEQALRQWDDPAMQQAIATAATRPTATRPVQRPDQSQPGSRRSSGAGRRKPPPPRSTNELGCSTWIIGSILLIAILGIVIAVLQWGPGLFESGPAKIPTATQASGAEGQPTTDAEGSTGDQAANQAGVSAPSAQTQPAPTPAEPTATPSPETRSVPDFRNASETEARNTAGSFWNLNVEEEFNDTVSAGLVVRQDPQHGSDLEQSETITVWISLGPQEIQIPELAGDTPTAAESELVDLGFTVTTINEPSETVAENRIIRTEPATSAEYGSEIRLIVSLGDVVVVPDIREMDVLDATSILQLSGLTIRNVTPQPCTMIQRTDPEFDCDAFPNNSVVSTSLEPAQIVDRDTEIDVVYYQKVDVSP